jgi:hypothetical protein
MGGGQKTTVALLVCQGLTELDRGSFVPLTSVTLTDTPLLSASASPMPPVR